MLQQSLHVLSAGSATQVVAPTIDSGHYLLKNIQPADELGEYSRQGFAWAASQYFQIANNGTAIFSFTTGASGAQIDYWNFDSSDSSVIGELIEGATITTTGSAIPSYNLDRNTSGTATAVLIGASALTGGTVVYSNYIGASNQASGGAASNQIITLKPSTQYGFRFRDVGGNGTYVHALITWLEIFNGQQHIWLGTKDDSFVLRGGEEIKFKLFPGEAIDAIAGHNGAKLVVIRQD